MIGTSTSELLFIRFWVLFLNNVAPISLSYTILAVSSFAFPSLLSNHRLHVALEVWLAAECAFYLFFFLPYSHHLQREAIHPPATSRESRSKLFYRCMSNTDDLEQYLSRWFFGAHPCDIKRDNVHDFLAWAFFDTARVADQDQLEIDDYIHHVEVKLGRKLEPGRGNARVLRLTLDQVSLLHRSLVWYWCIFVVDTITYCSMTYNGFHLHRESHARFFNVFPFRPLTLFSSNKTPAQNITYWHRKHTAKDKLPILFIHGIGVGLYPYTNFLRDINQESQATPEEGQIGIIALEIMPVSSRIAHAPLDEAVMVRGIYDIVRHHGWDRFILASHSYGSAISTHLLKSPLTAPLIGPVVLIDPVTLLLHLPDVAYNFVARKPKRANEWQMWYFASMDMGVAHTLARHFFWSRNIIWKDDFIIDGLHGNTFRDITVALSGQDLIVDTKSVRKYLTSPDELEMANGLTNGGPNGAQNGGPKINGSANGTAHMKSNGTTNHTPNDTIQQLSGVTKYALDGTTHSKGHTDSGPVQEAWTGNGLEVLWSGTLDHAQVFDSLDRRRRILTALQVYSAKG